MCNVGNLKTGNCILAYVCHKDVNICVSYHYYHVCHKGVNICDSNHIRACDIAHFHV